MRDQNVVSTITLSHRGVAKVHKPRLPKPSGLAAVTDIAPKLKERTERAAAASENEQGKRKRKAKATWSFTTDTKNRFEGAAFELNFQMAGWSLDNPPFFAVIVAPGSAFMKANKKAGSKEVFFEELVPRIQPMNVILRDKLADRFKSAFQMELNALVVLEFQESGNPHWNVYMTRPRDLSGSEKLSNHPKGKGGSLAKKFNGLGFADWFELTIADLTGMPTDFGTATRKKNPRRLTWVPRPEEVMPATSLEDYTGRFVNYMRKDGDGFAEKREAQHTTPSPYVGQMFEWWFIIGFTNMRRTNGEREVITCRTRAADLAMRNFFGARTRRERTYTEMEGGVFVDVSMWSTELHEHCLTGGTFERPLTPEEIRELRRLIMVKNQIPDEDITSDSLPEKSNLRKVMLASLDEAPAPWERDDFDFDQFVAGMYPEVLEEAHAAGEGAELLSFEQLMLDCGFSVSEQRAAARTARRRAWKAERVALRAAAEDDLGY